MDPRPSMYSSPSYCTFLWGGLLLSYRTTWKRKGCSEVLARIRITSKKNMLQLAEMFLMLFFRGIGIAKRQEDTEWSYTSSTYCIQKNCVQKGIEPHCAAQLWSILTCIKLLIPNECVLTQCLVFCFPQSRRTMKDQLMEVNRSWALLSWC